MLETGVEEGAGEGAFDYVRFWQAGSPAKGEFHCSECGYGVTVTRRLPICPMCAGTSWEQHPWSPLTRASAHLL